MRRRLALLVAPLLALGLAASVVTGCKQKLGERCQIADDCESGLDCAKGNNICVKSGSGTGSNPTADANVDGGPPADASVDARVDATPDAP